MYLVPGFIIGVGIYRLLSQTELIYDNETVEKKTKFFGFEWSHKVDRSLVRDIGPVAAGLVAPKSCHDHHGDHH
ncbi:MAG: hypothetical protein EOP04_19835 [Proteobacteria bacterium]|nr:MAG: hypothetical protein EOP04_19835 [Pseudomonadota bacterium]